MKTQTKEAEVKTALKKTIFLFITINTLLNEVLYTHILIDSKCLCFNIMIKKTVEWNKLEQFSVPSQRVINIMSKTGTVNKIAKAHINVDEYTKICYFYIKNNNLKYDLILNRS